MFSNFFTLDFCSDTILERDTLLLARASRCKKTLSTFLSRATIPGQTANYCQTVPFLLEEVHQGLDQYDQDHDQLLAPLFNRSFVQSKGLALFMTVSNTALVFAWI